MIDTVKATFKTVKIHDSVMDAEYRIWYGWKDLNESKVFLMKLANGRYYINDKCDSSTLAYDYSIGYDSFLAAIEMIERTENAKWDNKYSDMPVVATSTKTYGDDKGFAVAYRQAPAESHCRFNHGYAMKFHFEFECCELDKRNWAVDYGSLKSLKNNLDDWFDHKTLVSETDPERDAFQELADRGLAEITWVEATGCEALATWLWDYMENIWLPDNGYSPRVRMRRVEVRETTANMAYVDRSIYG